MSRRRGPTICAEDECNTLTLNGRCDDHLLEYTPAERKRMGAAVAAHKREHGDWCFGDEEHDAHATSDLTADHVVPVVLGGMGGPLVVRCRSSNSRDGARL